MLRNRSDSLPKTLGHDLGIIGVKYAKRGNFSHVIAWFRVVPSASVDARKCSLPHFRSFAYTRGG